MARCKPRGERDAPATFGRHRLVDGAKRAAWLPLPPAGALGSTHTVPGSSAIAPRCRCAAGFAVDRQAALGRRGEGARRALDHLRVAEPIGIHEGRRARNDADGDAAFVILRNGIRGTLLEPWTTDPVHVHEDRRTSLRAPLGAGAVPRTTWPAGQPPAGQPSSPGCPQPSGTAEPPHAEPGPRPPCHPASYPPAAGCATRRPRNDWPGR